MATVKRCCSWKKTSSDGERRPKSVNLLLGCFFLINYNLGDSYLTYPYLFYHAGYLAAISTLLLVTFVSTVAATWEIEVMARAQVGVWYSSQVTKKFSERIQAHACRDGTSNLDGNDTTILPHHPYNTSSLPCLYSSSLVYHSYIF